MTPDAAQPDFSKKSNLIVLLMLAVLLFNPLLAAINNHVTKLSPEYVIVAELMIDAFALLAIIQYRKLGRNRSYFYGVCLLIFTLSAAVFTYNQKIDIKSVRDFVVVLLFWRIGMMLDKETFFSVMKRSAVVVLAFSLLEILIPSAYTALLNPASYYYYTRGVAGDASAMGTDGQEFGLYKTTNGYEGRFSLNFLSDHRLSSLFLEPVSFGNFCIIAFIFCFAYWKMLRKREQLVFWLLFAIGTIGSESRTATFISVIILLYLPLSKRINAAVTMYYIPLIYLFSCVLSIILEVEYFSDTLGGRLSWSGFLLMHANIGDLLLGNLNLTGLNIPDAGYFYIITTHTIFGLFVLSLMASLHPRSITSPDKVLVHGLVLFFAIKMLISSSLFSIKVSPFMWMGIGFVCGGGMDKSMFWASQQKERLLGKAAQTKQGFVAARSS